MSTEDSSPLVSVVVPFLDPDPGFLAEAIESVAAQRFREWELLLVNDGSGPAATEAAERHAGHDPDRIRLLEHPGRENRGVPAARNLGIAEARGEFVAFLDADDVWLPGRLGAHLALLEAHPRAAMVFGSSLYWSSWHPQGSEDFIPPLNLGLGTLLEPPTLLLHLLRGEGAVPCPTSITCRTEPVLRVGGFVEDFPVPTEDQAFFMRLLMEYPAIACGEVLDRYRQHPESATGSASAAEEARWRRVLLDWTEELAHDHSGSNPQIIRAIRRERWALDHPRGARVLRTARRLQRRLKPSHPEPQMPPERNEGPAPSGADPS